MLKVVLKAHPACRGGKITLNQWAQRLGYRSPRTIAMVVAGQRTASDELVTRLARDLGLNKKEARYLELLGRIDRQVHKNPATVDPSLVNEASSLKGAEFQSSVLPLDSFVLIAQWHHLVIKQLVETPGFRPDPAWIRERLGRKVTLGDVRQALSAMLRLGLLGQDEETGALRVLQESITTPSDLPSSAIRNHHRQMMARATEALAEKSPSDREMRSSTFRFDKARLAEAKAELRRFHQEFQQRYAATDAHADAVYQCNVQFFEHTTPVAGTDDQKEP